MGLTRLSSGLIRYDAFGSDTSASYPESSGTLSVSGGVLVNSTGTWFTYSATSGVFCVTHRGSKGDTNCPGLVLCQNSTITTDAATRDVYRVYYDGFNWVLAVGVNNSFTTLATSATPDPAPKGTFAIARLYVSANTVYAKMGLTAFTDEISASDSTYTSGLYGGGYMLDVESIDWLDYRTAHTITCSGMTTGHYLRVSDGTTAAEAQESSGTATVDAGAVLFPLASVQIRTAAAGGGDLIAELTTTDYADMGGGDAFAYSAASAAWLPFMKHNVIGLGGLHG